MACGKRRRPQCNIPAPSFIDGTQRCCRPRRSTGECSGRGSAHRPSSSAVDRLLQCSVRPASLPCQCGKLQSGSAGTRVVGTEHHNVQTVGTHQDRPSSGPEPTPVPCKKFHGAALCHRDTMLVDVRSGDALRAADYDVVRAPDPTAAKIPGNKQIVITAVTNNKRRLDRLPVRRRTWLRGCGVLRLPPGCQRAELRVPVRDKARPVIEPP